MSFARQRVVGLALICLAVVGCASTASTTTVYVVRHAEKAPGEDPDLTAAGEARANALGAQLAGAGLDAVYATQYKRTQQTVAPTAATVGLEVTVVSAKAIDELVARVRRRHRGQRVLVAAHSNTVPDILKALGVRQPVTIDEKEYGDLFVVILDGDGGAVLRRERFGD